MTLNAAWGSNYSTFESAGGWRIGSGLMDENGRNTAWLGLTDGTLRGATAGVTADLDAFLFGLGDDLGVEWLVATPRTTCGIPFTTMLLTRSAISLPGLPDSAFCSPRPAATCGDWPRPYDRSRSCWLSPATAIAMCL